MHNDKFYQVVQGHGSIVGFFKNKSNAEKYMKQFNTRVEIDPVRVIEREFLDKTIEEPNE